MEVKFAKKVKILGTDYKIEVKREDPLFAGEHAGAYGVCSWTAHKIIIRDRSEWHEFKNKPDDCIEWMKKTLRHEIVHAFFNESGLSTSSNSASRWARNEEMVDWIALQGPKMYKAWEEAGAL